MSATFWQSSTSRRTVLGTSALLPLSAVLTGCSDKPKETSEQARDLVVGATDEPTSMDPVTTAGASIPQALLYNLFETLVKLDGEGNLKPLLAQSWTTSPDRKTYTFSLQPKAKFSDGSPVDAKAVVTNLERVRTAGLYKDEMAVMTKVEATDDQTVTVTLSRPSQEWLYQLTGSAGIIALPSAITGLAAKPVGSGPFSFDAWHKGESVVLTRNKDYWGTSARFDKVTFRYFADANSLNSAMLAGDIDIISDVTAPEALTQFSDTSKYTVTEGTTNGEVMLALNHGGKGNPALRKVQVRQAICHAIDRKALLDAVWGGKGELIGSMVPPTDPWYEDLSQTYAYDPAKAKELLKQAAVANLTLRLRVPTLPYAPAAAQFITSQLKAVGITVKVEELDFPNWLKQVYGDADYDMTIVNHVEPHDMVQFANPKYYWRYDNKEFAKLIAEADAADTEGYVATMKKAAKMLATDAAACWLWIFPHLVVTKAGITGVQKNTTSASFDLTVLASRNG